MRGKVCCGCGHRCLAAILELLRVSLRETRAPAQINVDDVVSGFQNANKPVDMVCTLWYYITSWYATIPLG